MIKLSIVKMKKFTQFLVFLLAFWGNGYLYSQIPSDLSKIKSSQITDAQLMQFVQQAQSSGMSEAELMAEFQKKGFRKKDCLMLNFKHLQ
jgi:hypothetical protein